jgi:hypothetical protein
MREHVLLFCLLGLVLTATIILVTAPEAVTWALSLIERASRTGPPRSRGAEVGVGFAVRSLDSFLEPIAPSRIALLRVTTRETR